MPPAAGGMPRIRFVPAHIWMIWAALTVVAVPARAAGPGTPEAAGLVDITKAVPDIRLDIRYATPNNFTHG